VREKSRPRKNASALSDNSKSAAVMMCFLVRCLQLIMREQYVAHLRPLERCGTFFTATYHGKSCLSWSISEFLQPQSNMHILRFRVLGLRDVNSKRNFLFIIASAFRFALIAKVAGRKLMLFSLNLLSDFCPMSRIV
jgi:hypothetical protein